MPATWVIAVGTLISRVMGLLRESVFGYFFSTSELLSAFRIAFMAPNLARRLFGEGALSSAMVPVLSEALHAQGEEASRRFIGRLLIAQAVVLLGLTILIEMAIGVWRLVADDIALELAAVLMPYMALICTVAVGGAVLNVRGHFAVPAAAPLLLNLAIIVAAMVGAGVFRWSGRELMYVICVSVLAAGVLQLIATGLALRTVRFMPIFEWRWRDERVRKVMLLMGPMVLGLSAVQINSLFDYLIAYLFVTADGQRVGPAVLGYAQYLYQLPLGVFGIAIATAIFPSLSDHVTRGDDVGLSALFFRGLRLSLFIALPAGLGLMFVARPLVATLYERGAFTAEDTRRVAATLCCYSIGMPAYFAQHLIVRLFYARQDSRTPARVAGAMVAINVVLNLGLVQILEERGLALATSTCAYLQAAWLLRRLPGVAPAMSWRQEMTGFGKIVLATVAMGLILTFVFVSSIEGWLIAHGNGVLLAVAVLAGIASYVSAARLLGMDELRTLWQRGRTTE